MAKRTDSGACGVLAIDKPKGLTSHDVVNRVRRCLGTRRVGHAGTLDPAATGVLLVCVGQATRLVEYLVASTKEYEGVVLFGVETDTYDQDGVVVEESDASHLTREAVATALRTFVGEIEQKPPSYSAIKQQGVPAYKLARGGTPVDLAARRVRIEEIELLDYSAPRARIFVRCQAGTYMRSLAHDLGARLGTCAHLSELERVASGSWRVENCIALDDLLEAAETGTAHELLLPSEAAVRDLPSTTLSLDQVERLGHGREISLETDFTAKTICGLDPQGRLVAILQHGAARLWRPRKVFRDAVEKPGSKR